MLDRRWRSRPLAADALSAFVEKQRGVAGPRMEPVRLLATSASFWLCPGSDADSIACMRRLVAMARVMVDAEVPPATSDRLRRPSSPAADRSASAPARPRGCRSRSSRSTRRRSLPDPTERLANRRRSRLRSRSPSAEESAASFTAFS